MLVRDAPPRLLLVRSAPVRSNPIRIRPWRSACARFAVGPNKVPFRQTQLEGKLDGHPDKLRAEIPVRFALLMFASVRSAPAAETCVRSALAMFAPARSAPASETDTNSAFWRSAPVRTHEDRSEPLKLAPRR